MEPRPTASKEKAQAALDSRLNERFRALGFIQIGSKDSQGRVISVQTIIEGFRRRTRESAQKETQVDALAGFLIAYEVPPEKAIEIGVLWGARYGVPKIRKDLPFSTDSHVGNESSATFIEPLIHRKPSTT